MTSVGLDWNATRALAVLGAPGDYPLPVPLEPPAAELPMALSLERGQPQLGSAGVRLCRRAPHLVCTGFLPWLGVRGAPTWQVGRSTFDVAQAAALVWERLHALCRSSHGVAIALPAYLHTEQAALLRRLGESRRLPILGSVPTPLAAALASHAQQQWSRAVVVADVDDHALTLTLVLAVAEQAHVVETRAFPSLGLRAWKERLVNAVSDCCVWQTRRDPRGAPEAEQGLYDQLDGLLNACQQQQPVQFAVQSSQWFHHLLIQPAQTLAFCDTLLHQTVDEADALGCSLASDEAAPMLVLTHAAGRLPGLVEALRELADAWGTPPEHTPRPHSASDDFGENLLFEMEPEHADIIVLSPDAPARAAHRLAEPIRQGELPRGHLETIVPLPLAEPVESGPARLHYLGRDHLLGESNFVVGTHGSCQLVIDADRHPDVAARHCEILFDHRTFILVSRGRAGTLVNDAPVNGSVVLRAGDRIHLGPHGPALRFLGRLLPRAGLVTA